MGENSTMHFDEGLPTLGARGRAEATDVRDPFAIASLVVLLCRRIRAWVAETTAMERWGYSRMRTWLDFSGDGDWPLQSADDPGALGSIARG